MDTAGTFVGVSAICAELIVQTVASVASATERTNGVAAGGVRVAVVRPTETLIDLRADDSCAFVSTIASALIGSDDIDTGREGRARVVLSGAAFIDVEARKAVALEAHIAGASE